MAQTIEVPVLVVGGGSVGLTLAIDLSWRGDRMPEDPEALVRLLRGMA